MYTKKLSALGLLLITLATTSQATNTLERLKRGHEFLNKHGMKINFGVSLLWGVTNVKEISDLMEKAGGVYVAGSVIPRIVLNDDLSFPQCAGLLLGAPFKLFGAWVAGGVSGLLLNRAISDKGRQIGRGLVKLSGNRLTMEKDEGLPAVGYY